MTHRQKYRHMEPLNLRCEWCKGLFQWKPRSTDHAIFHLRRTCSRRCANALAVWENAQRGKTL